MKINSIYIASFGGLKNFKLDLFDGLNVVYGDNENGKSTIMAFIKMMFYGSERGSAQISKNIRKKYTPWDASVMAGSIDFEHNGKAYRIEREFRTSNSTDKVTLCDLALGIRQTVSGDCGAQFFGLSAAAFERSIFIGQLGFPENDSAAEGEINSKLSNIALTGDESISFETVNSRIQKAKTALMSKSGRAGIYDKNLKTCAELKARIEKANEQQNIYNLAKSKIASLQEELNAMLESAKELKIQLNSEQDIRNAEKLKSLLELKSQLDALNQNLRLDNGEILDEMFLRKLQFCISKLQTVRQKQREKLSEKEMLEKSIAAGLNPSEDATEENANKLRDEISNLKARQNEIHSLLPDLHNNETKLQTQAHKGNDSIKLFPLIGIGLILIALAVIFAFSKLYVPLAFSTLIGIILIVAYPILVSKSRKSTYKIQKEIEEVQNKLSKLELEETKVSKELFEKNVKLEAILTSLNNTSAIIENQQKLLIEIEGDLSNIKNEVEAEESALFSFYSRYRKAETAEQIVSAVDDIAEKTASGKELKQKINYILKDLNGISYDEAAEKLEKISLKKTDLTIDFEQLKQNYDCLVQKITDHKATIASLTAQASASSTASATVQKLTDELNQLLSITKSQKEFCDIADIAMENLLESFTDIRKSYGSVLEKKAAEIFSGLTGKKYQDMSISKAFEITVNEADVFGSRDIAYLSSGTADQAYLSLRLALSSLICDDTEILPVLLDDALTQYDDTRLNVALEFLSDYAKSSQVIMFTCHGSIIKYAENFDSKIIYLNT